MSSRRPPPSASGNDGPGDDDPTPPRGGRGPDDRTDWDEEWDDEWDEPNYLVRRVVTVGAVVAGIALLAVVASRFIGGDSASTPTSDAAKWNTIVVVTDDAASVLNDDGTEELDTLSGESLDNTSVVAGRILVSLSDRGQVTQTDLEDGSVRRGRAASDATLRISGDNPSIAFIDEPSGGDVTVVDTVNRDLISIGDVAELDDPLIFADDVRVNAAGTHVAAPVPTLFQSFVIDLDTTTSTALAGRVIAINDEVVVTEQPAGDRAELEFYDLEGDRLGSVDVTAPEASMLLADNSMLLVASDGTISTASAEGTEDVGAISDPDGRRIEIGSGSAAHDRLLVAGTGSIYILGTDGEQIGTADGRLAVPTTRQSRCIAVASGTGVVGIAVVDIESGEPFATLERGIAVASSVDGCTVAVGGGRVPQLITDGEATEVDADSIVDVAPDGSAMVVVNGRRTEFLPVDGDEPVQLADEPAIVRFAQR